MLPQLLVCLLRLQYLLPQLLEIYSATTATTAATYSMPYGTANSGFATRGMPSAIAVTSATIHSIPYVTANSATATQSTPYVRFSCVNAS